jgi:DDE family transposase
MHDTPFFRPWRSRLARLGSRTAHACHQVRAYTLCQLENCFTPWVPPELFPKATAHLNSRDRDYTRWRTFWCMVWQALNPNAPGREVVRQLQALFRLEGGPQLSSEDGAYCRAKQRLPLSQFPKVLAATAKAADQQVPARSELQGRPTKVADGSALTLADTRKNRRAYPPLQCADKPTFPMMRIVVLFSLLSGAVLALAEGSLAVSELSLLTVLSSQLASGDILVGDRGFGYYAVIAWLQHFLKVDFIGRSTRRLDGRRRFRRLGRNDWLFVWQKPQRPAPWLTLLQWAGVPTELTVRVVKGSCYQKGFRVRQVKLVTTLLDPQFYPAEQILRAYLRRWRLEMCLDDLKTTLEMETLRGRSPDMVRKEAYTRLIAHNLIRGTIAQAATEHSVVLERISFKGTLDAVRHFTHALARTRSKRKRQELWAELLHTLATDLVPERPGRREPRAVKRKKNKYPRLDAPRRRFRDHPKRNTRRKTARLRKLGLM